MYCSTISFTTTISWPKIPPKIHVLNTVNRTVDQDQHCAAGASDFQRFTEHKASGAKQINLSFKSDSSLSPWPDPPRPGAVARSEACSLGMQAAPSSIPTSGTFFRGDLAMKTFLRPFSLFRWFKKSSCQLLAKECALSTGKLPRRLAQEQCG